MCHPLRVWAGLAISADLRLSIRLARWLNFHLNNAQKLKKIFNTNAVCILRMRVFKHSDNVKEKIAREMINIEAGLLYFEPGKDTINAKPTLYPEVERDNIKTTIRSHVGFIYLPFDVDMEEFMKGVETYLTDYDLQLGHLSKYMRLERNNGQFTAMKAKNNMTKTTYAVVNKTGYPDNYTKRAIFIGANVDMHIYRFHWFVYNTRTMVKNIEQFDRPAFPATTQFVSILYDKFDYLTATDGQKLESNITFQHFKVFQNLITFDPLQEIVDKELAAKEAADGEETQDDDGLTDEERQEFIDNMRCPKCQKKFKAKGGLTRHIKINTCKKLTSSAQPNSTNIGTNVGIDQTPLPGISAGEPLTSLLPAATTEDTTASRKPCPFCQRSFKTSSSLKTHMKKCKKATSETMSLAKATIQKDNLTKFLQMKPEEKQKHLDLMGGHPEYVPQWNDTVYDAANGIALCKKRGAAFELIRHFGRWEKFNDAFNNGIIALHKLVKPLFYEEFHNVIVENKGIPKNRKTLYPNTASYSDTEICASCYTPLYGDIYFVCNENNTGTAICPTCMHYEPFMHSPVKATQQLLRISYPTTAVSLVNKTNFIPLKKEILVRCFGALYVDGSYGSYGAFYLGNLPKPTDPNPRIEYLGWTGFLSDFINYIDSNNEFSQLTKQPTMKFLDKTKIFPAKLIRY